jgi:RNA polymerase sigma-70 factor (ECF subfamily)
MKTKSATWSGAIPEADDGDAAPRAGLLMNDETFSGFYQRTARPLWAYLARVSGNAALADDLLQESYLRLLSATFVADGEIACRRYLFRIATNLLRDHWRRPVSAPLEELPESALAAGDSRVAERIDSQALLGHAFMRMRPRERQLLWLAYAEGSSHREIAQITGLGSTSISLLLFRARRKLARLLRLQNIGPRRGI